MHLRLPMWSAVSKTRSSTINKKEVQILLKIVHVLQLHTYTLVTTNCRKKSTKGFLFLECNLSWNINVKKMNLHSRKFLL